MTRPALAASDPPGWYLCHRKNGYEAFAVPRWWDGENLHTSRGHSGKLHLDSYTDFSPLAPASAAKQGGEPWIERVAKELSKSLWCSANSTDAERTEAQQSFAAILRAALQNDEPGGDNEHA